MQISSDFSDDNLTSSYISVSENLHPMLNYSIQTGEEFSLQFLRERANARKNQNDSSGVNIKGVAGLQSCGFENGQKLQQKDSSAINNKIQSEPITSAQRVPCGDVISMGVSDGNACSTSYNNSSAKMRFLCSYGGKILPRPSDGKLRYVGGHTHIIQIHKDISFKQLKEKTISISSMPHIIKYQLPGEDLDPLVSVSCDEDLQNMIEEFNILEDDRSRKLRMFLFFSGDIDEVQFNLGSKEGDSEIDYVAAVNCMELRSTEDSTSLMKSTNLSDLDQLLNFGNADGNATKYTVEMQSDRLNALPQGEVLIHPMENCDIFPMYLEMQKNKSTLQTHQIHLKHALDDNGSQPQKVLGPEKDSLTLGVQPDNSLHERDGLYPVNQLPKTDTPYPHRPYQSADVSMGTSALSHSSMYRSKSHDCIGSETQISNPPPLLVPHDSQFEAEQSISASKQAYPNHSATLDAIKKTENSSQVIEPTHTNLNHSYSNLSDNISLEYTKSIETAFMGTILLDTENVSTQRQPEKTLLCDSEFNILNSSTVAISKQQVDSAYTSQTTYPNNAMENDRLSFDSEPLLGDILADINNRFPPPLVSGIFKAKNQESSNPSPSAIYNDKLKMTVNLQNPEPKNWSFFQNLAQDQFHKDFSLIDQDHVNYNYPSTVTMAAISKGYDSTQIKQDIEKGNDNSPSYFGDEICLENFNIVDNNATCRRQGFSSSGAKVGMDGEGMQVMNPFLNAGENHRAPVSDYKEGKLDVEDAGYPFIDFPAGFDLNNLQNIKNEDLEELTELGSGSFGTVYHGKWRGTDVAIKRIKKSCLTGRSSEQERLTLEFWKEAEILSCLHHPNVVAFYGVVRDGPDGTLATLTEYMVNGSLRHVLMRKDSYLDHRKQHIIAMDTAFGMEYLHSKNIIHFDLKCDNLLVNLTDPHRPICKVGDFGLSKIKRNTLVSGGVRGTLPWMAPELLSSSKVSEKVDVFSFGIVMWEILTGEEPYSNMHYGAIIGGIVNNTLRPPIPKSCDPDWRTLMEQCWDADPSQRPSFTEIANRLRLMSSAHHRKPSHK